jgi:hypothetical protein
MFRRFLVALLITATTLACSDPPTKEREQAEGALAAARAAGADTYAPEELRAAETSLAEYDAAVSQGDYRLALSVAIEARESAYTAARRAADGKASARSEAEALVRNIEADTAALTERLSGPRAERPAPRVAARARATLALATSALQETRSRMQAQDYRGVIESLAPIQKDLARDLAPPAPPAPRTGR